MFAGLVGVSSDRRASTMLREEPLSLRLEREGRQGFTRLFGLPLAREGLSAEAPSGASLGRGASAFFAEGAP